MGHANRAALYSIDDEFLSSISLSKATQMVDYGYAEWIGKRRVRFKTAPDRSRDPMITGAESELHALASARLQGSPSAIAAARRIQAKLSDGDHSRMEGK